MRPHIVMHMMSSIDGRIITGDWPDTFDADVYEDIHRTLAGDAWIVGRTTMAEFAQGEPRPVRATQAWPRETWKAPAAGNGPYAIALDRHGKLHLNMDRANGDALVAILTEAVSDDHLEEFRRDGISYVFAGKTDIDLEQAVTLLADEFGIKRLLLEGGGGINGSFLDAGLIDEISLLLLPLADGSQGNQTLFERPPTGAAALTLQSVDQREDGVLHLRYAVRR